VFFAVAELLVNLCNISQPIKQMRQTTTTTKTIDMSVRP